MDRELIHYYIVFSWPVYSIYHYLRGLHAFILQSTITNSQQSRQVHHARSQPKTPSDLWDTNTFTADHPEKAPSETYPSPRLSCSTVLSQSFPHLFQSFVCLEFLSSKSPALLCLTHLLAIHSPWWVQRRSGILASAHMIPVTWGWVQLLAAKAAAAPLPSASRWTSLLGGKEGVLSVNSSMPSTQKRWEKTWREKNVAIDFLDGSN